METREDGNTRYFIEIDLITGKVTNINWGDRHGLKNDIIPQTLHRIYLTKGQFNKFKERFETYKTS